jgi:hypothetical protein
MCCGTSWVLRGGAIESSIKLAIAWRRSECKLTMMSEVVQLRHVPGGSVRVARVWQACVGISQFVKERVNHGVDGRQTLCWRVFKEFRDQIDGTRISLSEHLCTLLAKKASNEETEYRAYLTERMRLDLGELVLHVIGVHRADLVPSGCSKHFDDLHELVDTRLAREQRLSEHELCHNATGGPDIYTFISFKLAEVMQSTYRSS